MDSFYGGKQGISFIIKDRFESIEDMENAFLSDEYDNTWYGQYCIIDTPNKNNKDNGKIFKRTAHNGTNNASVYEYVGQIVGPAGGIPNIELKDLEKLNTDFQKLDLANGGLVYYYNGEQYIQETSTATITMHPSGTISPFIDLKDSDDDQLTPPTSVIYKSGKDYAAGVIPALKYGFYTFQGTQKNINTDEFPISTIGLGFEIPYVDFDIDSDITVTAYDKPAIITSSEENKFYTQYHLTIPAGVPGRYISNITTTAPNSNTRYYKLTDIQDDNTISNTTTPISISDITKIAIGEVYYYDTIEENDVSIIKPVSVKDPRASTVTAACFWLWNVNEVSGINIATATASISNFGQMTVSYTASNSVIYNLPLLRDLTITHVDDGPYMLEGYWGTNATSVTIGQVAPEHWGVWATELTRTASTTYEEGQFDQTITPNDTSVGNLGVYKYTNNDIETVEFYIGTVTGTATVWNKLGSDTSGSINIQIGSQNDFKIKNMTAPVIFTPTAVPTVATPDIWDEGVVPWK